MTRFGALKDPGPLIAGEYVCGCTVCAATTDWQALFDSEAGLAAHNLWTISKTVLDIRLALADGSFRTMLDKILENHCYWFPESSLKQSWYSLHGK
jgi:7-cyano-7-deazaguanine tRNA-ribosyltransferase